MLARQFNRTLKPMEYDIIGANARDVGKQKGNMYKGPDWFTASANDDDLYLGIYNK
jgi:hypothetical protein